ncbi:MAG: head completion/stabilization protein [Pseudomonadota bacterium]|nr:head completion/stabilization protein [Pseudomonadota bacterium]
MGFSASGQVSSQTVVNDGFWPDLDTRDFADASRLDGAVTTARLVQAITSAMVTVNRETAIRQMKAKALADDQLALAQVPSDSINGQSVLIFHYQTAVYSEARALLTEHYRDFDTTAEGDKRAKTLDPQIDAYRRESRKAIADLTDQSYSVVELI